MSGLSPFHLLEINLISVQDIAKVAKSMRTYAVAWVHPDRKLKTRVDTNGGINPTWNDKFIFRVDSQFLKSDTSAIMIEIYALHWFKDIHVGTVRVLIGNIIPPQTRSHNQNHIGMRFVALQVRRRSGRPQGILNIGVTVLDSSMRSMPLYTQLSASAVGYQTLMGQDERHSNKPSGINSSTNPTKYYLRRTKSEKSSIIGTEDDIIDFNDKNSLILPKPNNSVINGSDLSSIVGKKGKLVYDKPLSVVDVADASSSLNFAMKLKAQKGISNSVLGFPSSTKLDGARNGNTNKTYKATRSEVGVMAIKKEDFNIEGVHKKNAINTSSKPKHNWLPPIDNKNQKGQEKSKQTHKAYYPMTKDIAARSIWSESEVGPSPSEVAAAIKEDNKYRQLEDGRSSMLDDKWTIEESEGVSTKLERWRMEMPPLEDYNYTTDSSSTIFGTRKHSRRHTYDQGKFSCFSNICGLECSIVCGKGDSRNTYKARKATSNKQIVRAQSIDSVSTYF